MKGREAREERKIGNRQMGRKCQTAICREAERKEGTAVLSYLTAF